MTKKKKDIKETSQKYGQQDNTNVPRRKLEMRYFNGTSLSTNTARWAHGHPMSNIRATNTVINFDKLIIS